MLEQLLDEEPSASAPLWVRPLHTFAAQLELSLYYAVVNPEVAHTFAWCHGLTMRCENNPRDLTTDFLDRVSNSPEYRARLREEIGLEITACGSDRQYHSADMAAEPSEEHVLKLRAKTNDASAVIFNALQRGLVDEQADIEEAVAALLLDEEPQMPTGLRLTASATKLLWRIEDEHV